MSTQRFQKFLLPGLCTLIALGGCAIDPIYADSYSTCIEHWTEQERLEHRQIWPRGYTVTDYCIATAEAHYEQSRPAAP